jgi:Mlc titration factor MtfA (ptsG expression regulator)
MRIHSVTVLLSVPFIIPLVYFGYRVLYLGRNDGFLYLLAFLTILIALYIFHPHIDYLWYKRFPALLNKHDLIVLERFSAFYNSLDEKDKEKFQKRIGVFTRAKAFKLMRSEADDCPEDFKIAVASSAVELTFNLDDYLFDGFDYYYIYMHPFPTPRIHPLHSVETDHEDGLVIINAEMLINSFNPANDLFNIGLYAFSGLFMHNNKDASNTWPEIEDLWSAVEMISGFEKNAIRQATGIENSSQFQILSTLFFTHNEKFKEILPDHYIQLCGIYNYKTK